MAWFVTRVELQGATVADYENLHRFMAEAQFARTIFGDDGVAYNLPSAEYSSQGPLSVYEVQGLAEHAASKTGKEFCVVVAETTNIAWRLKPSVNAHSLAALPLSPSPFQFAPPPPVTVSSFMPRRR